MTVVAVSLFVAWCIWLSVIDLRERRLPNRLTAVGAVAVPAYAALTGHASRAIVGGLVLLAIYLAIHLAAPRSFGAGDVKLAMGVGAAAGLGGAHAWVLAALLAPAFTAAAGMAVLMRRRNGSRRLTLAHGPSMCAATLLALACTGG